MEVDFLKQLEFARQASREMLRVSTNQKNQALLNIAEAIKKNKETIIQINHQDIENAKKSGMTSAFIDRLLLNNQRIDAMVNNIHKLVTLDDPIETVMRTLHRPNGLVIKQVRVPLGVLGIIYESRPNVTVDIACLCIKSSNVCVLKGGKEAFYTNQYLAHLMKEAVINILPQHVIDFVEETSREVVKELICANDYIDVIVPRGGKGLIDFVVKNATVPVIETGAGNCHLYIDKEADMKKAIDISINAKMQRPSVCNAIETILVHQDIADVYLPMLVQAFNHQVEIRGDQRVRKIIECQEATVHDYECEYNDYIVAVKIVESLEEAINHIFKYSTKHSECIVTENQETANLFLHSLDSACVYHNASTRFSDGGEFGFGVELGISTQKLHARGPLALIEMTSYQYRIYGQGQVRE